MKAVVFHEFGGTQGLRIEEVPEPEPNAGQLRIKVHAVAVRYQLQHVGSLAAKRAAVPREVARAAVHPIAPLIAPPASGGPTRVDESGQDWTRVGEAGLEPAPSRM